MAEVLLCGLRVLRLVVSSSGLCVCLRCVSIQLPFVFVIIISIGILSSLAFSLCALGALSISTRVSISDGHSFNSSCNISIRFCFTVSMGISSISIGSVAFYCAVVHRTAYRYMAFFNAALCGSDVADSARLHTASAAPTFSERVHPPAAPTWLQLAGSGLSG